MNTTKQETFRTLPAYSHVTNRQDMLDGFTGRVAIVVRRDGKDCLLETYADDGRYLGDVWLHEGRLQAY